jgi:hypothetical protein
VSPEGQMDTSILLIWIGALCVIGGVLFMAAQAMRGGRLSGRPRAREGMTTDTLEPRHNSGLGLKENMPGLALVALGGCLLLLGSAF